MANQTDLVAILDGTCSVISRNIFDITKQLSTVHVSLFNVCYIIISICCLYKIHYHFVQQIAYTPFAKQVDNSTKKVFFNEYPSTDSYGINMCTLLREFKWYNIVLITEHKLLEVQYNRHTLTCLYIMAI